MYACRQSLLCTIAVGSHYKPHPVVGRKRIGVLSTYLYIGARFCIVPMQPSHTHTGHPTQNAQTPTKQHERQRVLSAMCKAPHETRHSTLLRDSVSDCAQLPPWYKHKHARLRPSPQGNQQPRTSLVEGTQSKGQTKPRACMKNSAQEVAWHRKSDGNDASTVRLVPPSHLVRPHLTDMLTRPTAWTANACFNDALHSMSQRLKPWKSSRPTTPAFPALLHA